ncbi:conserved hypothetical protein [Leptothrix cholodnii SP-6]|uniref:Uncharacterized protein n=1 Tax=Leptothrix cholodnii (strain ATCC 51168 / LMG 8142 / SP-6) TaxID=395495 RepID=B1Y3N2_LEPCP|nr:hypothetical protein [Leptothrix cholodnii]ACB35735.1 conserved hypothetical protein [Leptothrix cholodnii SP-6]
MATSKNTKIQTTPEPAPAALPATADDLARQAKAKAEDEKYFATVMADGTINMMVTQTYLPEFNKATTVEALEKVRQQQVKAIAAGDLTQLEQMLLTQAAALQAMFIDLAVRAKKQNQFDGIQTMTGLALKCAAGSRQAITALAELRMPKTAVFAKQANVTTGPQQVNNGTHPQAGSARAEKIATRPNELLEASHEQRLDTRAQGQGGRADPGARALETVNRATHG